MDYSVKDSSIFFDDYSYSTQQSKDDSLRIGIVRECREVTDGTVRYLVEVFIDGNQVPISCQLMTRFGGPYNFEEYRLRAWANKVKSGKFLPTTISTYDFRAGDMVVVGFIAGKSREGIILGGIRHESRDLELGDDIEYISKFNGLETKIDVDGAYTVTFNGTPINEIALDLPGAPIIPPIYNPLTSGSFFGFDAQGGFSIDNNTGVSLAITKTVTGGVFTITSGSTTIEIDGTVPGLSTTAISTDSMTVDVTQDLTINPTLSLKAETLQLSLKGTQVAIGNDAIELVDGLIQILDGLGQVTVTSPVGTCTPIMASPQWASSIIPLIVKLNTLKGSL